MFIGVPFFSLIFTGSSQLNLESFYSLSYIIHVVVNVKYSPHNMIHHATVFLFKDLKPKPPPLFDDDDEDDDLNWMK